MRIFATTLAAVSLAALSACGSNDTPAAAASGAAAAENTGAMTSALDGAAEMKTLSGALKSTGLAGVLEGPGGYTLLAPTDTAFAALGDKAKLLSQPDQQAALAAILRNHMLPGALDTQDIAKAIDGAGGKPVTMRTLGSGTVTFAKDGDSIVVTGDGGAKAKVGASAIKAGNNSALPLDTVLTPT